MTKKSNGFLRLPHDMLDSDQWENLSPRASRALVLICRKFNGYNNGKIAFGQRELEARLPCSPATAVKVLRELQGAGLIEVAERSYFNTKTGPRDARATLWSVPFLRNLADKGEGR